MDKSVVFMSEDTRSATMLAFHIIIWIEGFIFNKHIFIQYRTFYLKVLSLQQFAKLYTPVSNSSVCTCSADTETHATV